MESASAAAAAAPAAAAAAAAAAPSLSRRLPSDLLSSLCHFLDSHTIVGLAQCDHVLQGVAYAPFAWRFAAPPLPAGNPAVLARAHASALVKLGAAPVGVVWSGQSSVEESMEQLQHILQLPRLASLDCVNHAGLTDAHLQVIGAHAQAQRNLVRLRLGGFHHANMSARAVGKLCEQLSNLTALSIDRVDDFIQQEDAPAAAAPAPAAPGGAAVDGDAAPEQVPNPLAFLPYLPGLRSLEIRQWLAEELTAPSLPTIATQLPNLTALYLENFESFTFQEIQSFFKTNLMTKSIRHLSLSYVDLGAHNLRQAFHTDPAAGIAAAAVVAPAGLGGGGAPLNGAAAAYLPAAEASLWSSLESLESLSLIRCRNAHTLFPHLLTCPSLRHMLIRGVIDSWGLELPKREDLLRLMLGCPRLQRLLLYAQTSRQADMDNLQAQLGAVNRVEFRDGNRDARNPGAF